MNISKINVPQLKECAYDVYRYAYNDDERMTDKLVEFYKEGTKNPTVARLIQQNSYQEGNRRYAEYTQEDMRSLRGNPIELVKEYWNKSMAAIDRIKEAKNTSPVKEYYENFCEKIAQLYPKTYAIRDLLLYEGRVSQNEIKPCLPKGIKKALKYARYF